MKAEQILVNLMAADLLGEELPAGDVFVTPLYARLAEGLQAGEKPAALLEELDEEERSEAARALLDENRIERDKIPQAVADCLAKIRLHRLDEEISRVKKELKDETAPERRSALMNHLVQLTNERGLTGRV